MDALYVQIEMFSTVRMDISHDYKIIGEVINLQTEIKELKTYFYSETKKWELAA